MPNPKTAATSWPNLPTKSSPTKSSLDSITGLLDDATATEAEALWEDAGWEDTGWEDADWKDADWEDIEDEEIDEQAEETPATLAVSPVEGSHQPPATGH